MYYILYLFIQFKDKCIVDNLRFILVQFKFHYPGLQYMLINGLFCLFVYIRLIYRGTFLYSVFCSYIFVDYLQPNIY